MDTIKKAGEAVKDALGMKDNKSDPLGLDKTSSSYSQMNNNKDPYTTSSSTETRDQGPHSNLSGSQGQDAPGTSRPEYNARTTTHQAGDAAWANKMFSNAGDFASSTTTGTLGPDRDQSTKAKQAGGNKGTIASKAWARNPDQTAFKDDSPLGVGLNMQVGGMGGRQGLGDTSSVGGSDNTLKKISGEGKDQYQQQQQQQEGSWLGMDKHEQAGEHQQQSGAQDNMKKQQFSPGAGNRDQSGSPTSSSSPGSGSGLGFGTDGQGFNHPSQKEKIDSNTNWGKDPASDNVLDRKTKGHVDEVFGAAGDVFSGRKGSDKKDTNKLKESDKKLGPDQQTDPFANQPGSF